MLGSRCKCVRGRFPANSARIPPRSGSTGLGYSRSSARNSSGICSRLDQPISSATTRGAAETMIRKGTAPAVDYAVEPSDDGRFKIVWKTAKAAPTDEAETETAEASAEQPAAASSTEAGSQPAPAATKLATTGAAPGPASEAEIAPGSWRWTETDLVVLGHAISHAAIWRRTSTGLSSRRP
jgi:hypothetical protein